MKEKLLVVFGGKSVENDISVITGLQAIENLPRGQDYLAVYIDKNGFWWTAQNIADAKIYEDFDRLAKKKVRVDFVVGENVLYAKKKNRLAPLAKISCVLNCCHGGDGEGGALQGYLNECAVAQTSPLVASSALCMDKCLMKDVFRANKIQTPNYVTIKKGMAKAVIDDAIKKLGFPFIVKPSNLGSSIGISVCRNARQLGDAIELAFRFDEKILVEKLVENLREFNCAVFRYKDKLFLSEVCEVKNKKEIYSFEDKYLSSGGKSEFAQKNIATKVKKLAEKIYDVFDCEGVVRVDFLYDSKQKVLYANEINTIPGSLSFYMFKGIKFSDLLASLIEQAKVNFERRKGLIKRFESDAVKIYDQSRHIKK